MKCIFCSNEFEQKQTGRTPKFCSAKCRVYFNRGIGVGEKIVELQKEIDVRDVNRVTGEVYETKEDKLDGLRAMIENVNQKHESSFEPEVRVETPQYPVPPKPGVILPAKRIVEYEEGEKVELIYEDNPL